MTRVTAGACMLLFAAAGVAAAAEMPKRRAGLWKSHIVGGPMGGTDMTVKTCVDPAQEHAGAAFSGRRPAGCAQGPMVAPAPGGGWAYHLVCKSPRGMTIDTSGVATGDFASGYTVKTITRMSPAPVPRMAESRMTVTSRWLGACPPGMKPGASSVSGSPLGRR